MTKHEDEPMESGEDQHIESVVFVAEDDQLEAIRGGKSTYVLTRPLGVLKGGVYQAEIRTDKIRLWLCVLELPSKMRVPQ